ncbi:MAG: hypothetical protein ACFFBD_06630 [Candidatus Hodarchaeota archaeon]
MLVCKRCQKIFDPKSNKKDCIYHSGQLKACLATFNSYYQTPWTQEGARFIMEHIDEDGPWWFWTCCNKRGKDAPGCTKGLHFSKKLMKKS